MNRSNDNNEAVGKRRKRAEEKLKSALSITKEAKKVTTSKRPTADLSITGSNNIVGDGNSINVYNAPTVEQKVVVVKTGDGVLTAAQKAKINALIRDWGEARGAVRKTKAEIASLRSSFNTYMGVNSYHEIKSEDFEKAIKWLQRQTGIINSMPSAKAKIPGWRNKRYASINARAKEFPDGEQRYRQYAQEKFGTGSLKELSDDQLDAVYRHVYGWARPKE